jgi:TorA maturation chaperone TorD
MVVAAADFIREELKDESAVLAPGEKPASEMNLQPMLDFFRRSAEHFEADYQNTFGLLMSKECPPYGTEYCLQAFSVFRSQELADIAGYYKAFGVEPSRDQPERQDHIALELEFMAWLIGKVMHADKSTEESADENADLCRDAQKNFFEKHMVWWIPAFCAALDLKVNKVSEANANGATPQSFYTCVAHALSAFIGLERNHMKIDPPTDLVEPKPDTDDSEMECSACCGEFANK